MRLWLQGSHMLTHSRFSKFQTIVPSLILDLTAFYNNRKVGALEEKQNFRNLREQKVDKDRKSQEFQQLMMQQTVRCSNCLSLQLGKERYTEKI